MTNVSATPRQGTRCKTCRRDCGKAPEEHLTKQQAADAARRARSEKFAEKRAELVQTVERLLGEGIPPAQIAAELGYHRPCSLYERMRQAGRPELGKSFRYLPDTDPLPKKEREPGVTRNEQQTREVQAFVEDVEWLFSWRGGYARPAEIALRLGYSDDSKGFEAIRIRLRRAGREDLRDKFVVHDRDAGVAEANVRAIGGVDLARRLSGQGGTLRIGGIKVA